MISKSNKINLVRKNIENNCIKPYLKSQSPKCDILNIQDSKNLNQLKYIENNNSSLNNNFYLLPSLNNNINNEIEIDNLNNQSKPTISDWKTFDLIDLSSSNISYNNIYSNIPSLLIKDNITSQIVNSIIQNSREELLDYIGYEIAK